MCRGVYASVSVYTVCVCEVGVCVCACDTEQAGSSQSLGLNPRRMEGARQDQVCVCVHLCAGVCEG